MDRQWTEVFNVYSPPRAVHLFTTRQETRDRHVKYSGERSITLVLATASAWSILLIMIDVSTKQGSEAYL